MGIGLALVTGLIIFTTHMRHPLPESGLSRDVSLALGNSWSVLDARLSDLDSDGSPEVAAITCRSYDKDHPMGGEIVVLKQVDGELKPLWRQPKLNPWKLQVADVDADGRPEVIAGVWKKSPKDPVMAKRTFVYFWNGKRLCPLWLGSRLSRRFDDFAVADVDGVDGAEIVALEVAPEGKHRVSVYRWKSFGCEWVGCSRNIKGFDSLEAEDNGVVTRGRAGTLFLQYRDGKVSLDEEIGRHDR